MNPKNLPQNWKVVRLGRVADIRLGKTPHRKVKSYWDNGTIPWVKIQDMTEKFIKDTSEKITDKAFKEIFHKNLISKGTILMSFKLTIGRTAFLEIDAVHNEAIVSIFPNPNLIDKNYLFYLLPALNYSELTGVAAKGETLNKEKIKNLPIPLPPLAEQKRIVEILSLAEELINKQKTGIVLIDKILMAKFLEMFGDPATNPKGWEVRKLGEVAEVKGGGTPSTKVKEYYEPPEINWITVTDVTINKSIYIYTSINKISQKGLLKSSAKLLPPNTVITSIAATVGEVRILKKEMATNQQFYNILPSCDFIPEYIAFVLRSMFQEFIRKSGTTTFKFINLTQFRNFQIPLPPIELQQKFAQIVEEFERKRKGMQNTLETLECLFKILQKKVFTGELTAEWREKQKVDWKLPKITQRQAILLALVYYSHIVLKKSAILTFVMKETFLLQTEAGLTLGYEFIPYKYGPFSKEVYEDIEELDKNLLVEKVKPKRDIEKTEVTITKDFIDWIEKIINKIPQECKGLVQTYVQKYGTLSYNELVDYVYSKYPEFTTKSKKLKNKSN